MGLDILLPPQKHQLQLLILCFSSGTFFNYEILGGNETIIMMAREMQMFFSPVSKGPNISPV